MHEQVKHPKDNSFLLACVQVGIFILSSEQDVKSTVSVSFFFVHYDFALASQSDEELT